MLVFLWVGAIDMIGCIVYHADVVTLKETAHRLKACNIHTLPSDDSANTENSCIIRAVLYSKSRIVQSWAVADN